MIVFALILGCLTHHQLTGTLYNTEREPLKGAKIKIEDLNIIAYSDGNGQFSIPDKKYKGEKFTSTHMITITYLGYEPKTMEISFNKRKKKLGEVILAPITINVPYRKKNLLPQEN